MAKVLDSLSSGVKPWHAKTFVVVITDNFGPKEGASIVR
jgi:hypothetical protein